MFVCCAAQSFCGTAYLTGGSLKDRERPHLPLSELYSPPARGSPGPLTGYLIGLTISSTIVMHRSRSGSASLRVDSTQSLEAASNKREIARSRSDTDLVAYDAAGHTIVHGYQYGPYSYVTRPNAVEMAPLMSEDPYESLAIGTPRDSVPVDASHLVNSHHHRASSSLQGFPHTPQASSSHVYSHVPTASIDSIASIRQRGSQMPSSTLTANNAPDTYFINDEKNAEPDDFIHDPAAPDYQSLSDSLWRWSWTELLNISALILIILGLIGVFAAFPIVSQILEQVYNIDGGWGLGGTNASGQVPGSFLYLEASTHLLALESFI